MYLYFNSAIIEWKQFETCSVINIKNLGIYETREEHGHFSVKLEDEQFNELGKRNSRIMYTILHVRGLSLCLMQHTEASHRDGGIQLLRF
jgi:hypothetical protein